MNRNFFILLVLWILSVVGISFYGGTVSYGFFLVLTLIPVMALVYILFVYVSLKIYQKPDGRNAVCSRPSDFYITLRNESFLSFSDVRVIFYSSFSTIADMDDRTVYELPGGSGVTRKTSLVCHYRGEYEVGIKRIVIRDFLGLFTISCRERESLTMIVDPAVMRIDGCKGAELLFDADEERETVQEVPEAQVREYMPGDDVRLIHWKASAALQKLMVRKRTGEETRGIAIVMDTMRIDERMENYLPSENRVLETVIALTLYFSERTLPVTVYYETDGFRSCPVHDPAGFESFYQNMCKCRFRAENDPVAFLEELRTQNVLQSSRAVFFVFQTRTKEAKEITEEIGSSQPSFFYLVTDEEESIPDYSKTPVITVPADKPFTEVSL